MNYKIKFYNSKSNYHQQIVANLKLLSRDIVSQRRKNRINNATEKICNISNWYKNIETHSINLKFR
jgi:hypothetical protein